MLASRILLKLLALVLVLTAAACQNVPSAPPQITVVITAVSDQDALDDAVGIALAGTAVQNAIATETQLAQANITLTPTQTSTPTITPQPPTETPFLSPTPTSTPTNTPTSTSAPLPSNTPASLSGDGSGRVRFVHAWPGAPAAMSLDVLIEDSVVARDFRLGQSTNYQRVTAGAVRVSVRPPAATEDDNGVQPVPLVTLTLNVPDGGSVSIALVELDNGLTLLPVVEDIAPLPSGQARLSILQANPLLLRANLVVPGADFILASNIDLDEIRGPFDLAAGTLPVQAFDADVPDELLANLNPLRLDSRVNYLMVLIPPGDAEAGIVTEYLLFSGSTTRTVTDTGVRFVNAASSAGALQIVVDDEVLTSDLRVGQNTVSLPVSMQGSQLRILTADGNEVYSGTLGPWRAEQRLLDKIILLVDGEPTAQYPLYVAPVPFFEESGPSLTRSNLRLIHGLTGVTRSLDLEIRSTSPTVITNEVGVPQSQQAAPTWSTVAQNVTNTSVSSYAVRNPGIFDVRLVLSGSTTAQAQLTNLQLLPGAVYDFIALPGGQGVAQLLLLQPEVQTGVRTGRGVDAALVQEQVEAILTASAPAVTATPTTVNTPTPTVTPVPTNTPRASNTPVIPLPSLFVDPAPPNAASNSFVLRAENFSPGRRYTIRLADGPENISGSIGDDGRLLLTVNIPANLGPGAHTVRICVDCTPAGAQQEAFAVFIVANPNRTATPTPDR